jgi:hypothetical protein
MKTLKVPFFRPELTEDELQKKAEPSRSRE